MRHVNSTLGCVDRDFGTKHAESFKDFNMPRVAGRADRDFGIKHVESFKDFNMPHVAGCVESKGSSSESTRGM